MNEPTREEHLAWCKTRALEYCDVGDTRQAFNSMMSDMHKHPETENHAALPIGVQMMFSGLLNNPNEMRRFITGFN